MPGVTDRQDDSTVYESLDETKDEIIIHNDGDDTVNIGHSNTTSSMVVVSKWKKEDKNKSVIHNAQYVTNNKSENEVCLTVMTVLVC